MWRGWGMVRQAKLNLVRFVRLKGTPEQIARGLALGIFIGMTPTMGLQMPIAVFCAYLLKENKLAAALGVWVTNPVTAPFIYALEYECGRLLLGMPRAAFPGELTFTALEQVGWQVIIPLWVGGLLFGVLCAPLTYLLTLRLMPRIGLWRVPRWPRRHFRELLRRPSLTGSRDVKKPD